MTRPEDDAKEIREFIRSAVFATRSFKFIEDWPTDANGKMLINRHDMEKAGDLAEAAEMFGEALKAIAGYGTLEERKRLVDGMIESYRPIWLGSSPPWDK